MNGFGEEVNDELSYGILMILRIQYSIDEGMPSEVALVCFFGGVLSSFEAFLVAYGKMFWSSYPNHTTELHTSNNGLKAQWLP